MMPKFNAGGVTVTVTKAAELHFGASDATVEVNGSKTVEQGYREAAEALEFDANRQVSYTKDGSAVAANAVLVGGASYSATVSFEDKGSR